MCAFLCGALNDNPHHKLRCFNTWYSVGGPVGIGFGVVTLLEEVCHLGQPLRFKGHRVLPVQSLLPP